MSTRGLHPTGDSRRERFEQHRARKISEHEWLKELHSTLRNLSRQLTDDEQRSMAAELRTAGTTLQRLIEIAADNSKGMRWPAVDVAGRIFLTMISRRYATLVSPAHMAARPDWSRW